MMELVAARRRHLLRNKLERLDNEGSVSNLSTQEEPLLVARGTYSRQP